MELSEYITFLLITLLVFIVISMAFVVVNHIKSFLSPIPNKIVYGVRIELTDEQIEKIVDQIVERLNQGT